MRAEVKVYYKGHLCKGRCFAVGAIRYIAISSRLFARSNYPSNATVGLLRNGVALRCEVEIRYFVYCDRGIALLEQIRERECAQLTTTYENRHCKLTQCLFFDMCFDLLVFCPFTGFT